MIRFADQAVKGQPSQRLLISTHSTQGLPLQKTIDFYTPGVDWDTEDQSAPTLLLKISDGLVIDKFADVSMSPVCEIIVGPNSAAFSGKVYKPSYSANEFQIDIGNAIQLAGKNLTQVAPVAYQIYLDQKGGSQNINDEPDGWGSVIGGRFECGKQYCFNTFGLSFHLWFEFLNLIPYSESVIRDHCY